MVARSPTAPPGALTGLNVIEVGDGTAGPYAAKLLGDFGAEVIKIEPLEGDSSRRRGPFPDGQPNPEASGLFLYLNTNKYGLALDLERTDAQAHLAALLADADIFVSNLPHRILERFGAAPAVLRKKYPRLIITTISPFGSTGPWADRRGDELVTFAMSGMAYSTPGMPDASADLEQEPPLHPSCFAAETVAGLVAATATLSAVLGRARTQEGCHVEVSQQAALAAMQIRDITVASYTGEQYNRLLNPTTIGRMPNFYLPCKDGYVTVAAPLDEHWTRLVEAMGQPEWALSDDYATGPARTRNWTTLRFNLMNWTMTLTGDELYAIAERVQLPMFPFYSIEKVTGSPHVQERGSLTEIETGKRKARMPGAPFAMAATPWQLRQPAPRLGEHNSKILNPSAALAS